jgi:uncharacterized protein
MNHKKRNFIAKIEKLLGMFPVVLLIGARQVGKTYLAKTLRPNWKYFDLESAVDFNVIKRDINFFFQSNSQDIIIDEAQELPDLFKSLRGVIDTNRSQKGRFILTGSSSPELIKGASESLAGRIAVVEIPSMKANEIVGTPLSQFYKIFDTELNAEFLFDYSPQLTLPDMRNKWLYGGYPEPVIANNDVFYNQWMQQYQINYINRDIARLFPKLDKRAYERFLFTLSKLSGTILNKSNLARAIEVSEGSVRQYLDIVSGTYLWQMLPSYEKSAIRSVVKMPKGYIKDSGLLHFLLQINSYNKLERDPIIGSSFEGFVIEEIISGLQATMLTNWSPYYYRTRKGSEIDLILDGPFGLLPVEIKFGIEVTNKALQSLRTFIDERQLNLGLVINQSDSVRWLAPKILQLPVNYL